MNIDSIKNGYVLDHIKAGKALEIYEQLGLSKLDCQVALITNAKSKKLGTKDIIKIDRLIDIDLDKFENYVLCDLTQYVDNNQRISHFGYLMFRIDDDLELSLGRKKNNHIKLKDIIKIF